MSLIGLLLSACSWLGLGKPAKAALESLRVIAYPNANGRMATAIDVVFVYQEEAFALLPKRAADWFLRRSEIVFASPGAFDVVSYQLPPGQMIAQVALPPRHGKALHVVAFSNYVETAGQHPVELSHLENGVLWLTQKNVHAAEEGEPINSSLGE